MIRKLVDSKILQYAFIPKTAVKTVKLWRVAEQ